ncbi:MAG: DUF211 domain-containing protein [Thermodesulfobacteriota bacterium]
MQLKKLIIDVLIPHEPDILIYVEKLCEIEQIENVNIKVEEVDDRTKSLRITIEGKHITFEEIKSTIERLGGAIHSIDEVFATSRDDV